MYDLTFVSHVSFNSKDGFIKMDIHGHQIIQIRAMSGNSDVSGKYIN